MISKNNEIFDLIDLGFNDELRQQCHFSSPELTVARVAVEYKNLYRVYGDFGEQMATISGKMLYNAEERDNYPAVGDWVIISKNSGDRTVIHQILRRKSKFVRKEAGLSPREQIVATNIDVAFICMSLNENFNLRRLERYITMTWDSGALPVVLLTKADLCNDIESLVEKVQEVSPGIEVICSSALDSSGVDRVRSYIKRGTTAAFLGSSGVGKSTIINLLIGKQRQATMETSQLGARGRHTTTNRELLILEEGGVVIDTPGMRELHIMDVAESIDTAFKEIEELSRHCHFSNCSHDKEPGCAVKKALADGTLSEERFTSYMKLKKEALHMEKKAEHKKSIENRKMGKKKNRRDMSYKL